MNKYIPWNGGICPVALSAKVQVKFSNGVCRTLIAGNLDWSAAPKNPNPILSYRVVG